MKTSALDAAAVLPSKALSLDTPSGGEGLSRNFYIDM